MVIEYKSATSEEVFFKTVLSDAFLDPGNLLQERKEMVEVNDSVIDQHELILHHIMAWNGRMSIKEDIDLAARIDFPVIQVIFSLTANTLYENYSGENDVFSFSPNQHNILFTPQVEGSLNRKTSLSAEQVDLYLHPNFYLKYLPHLDAFDNFRKSITQNQFAALSAYNMPITAEMKVLLKDIFNCQKISALKRLFIEARVIELLMLQMEQYEQIAGNAICNTLRKADIRKMHEVKQIIDSSWKEPCSLINLAQMVMTNEYNLKKSFKEVFGTTIFGYLNEVKMNEARRLLLSGEMNIAEVADIVGYKNPNHFTTAFKKHFGFVPSELR
jgi:AraC-like DNA-binding protein